ncbi:unnamed protein product [Onchocerca flexuosa]|uniref:Transmembrane protein n=1 Tax=Onchocerca flexuosa TaxID=387005 RepID=A0A183HPF7_9BILA|nr:unnamed protein product [Onchocerca flexuosa]
MLRKKGAGDCILKVWFRIYMNYEMNSSNPPLMKLNLVKKRTVITQDRKQANVGTNNHTSHPFSSLLPYPLDLIEVVVVTIIIAALVAVVVVVLIVAVAVAVLLVANFD